MGHFDPFKKFYVFLNIITFIQQCILRANTRRLHPPAVPARRRHPRKEAKKDGSLPAARQCQASRCFGHPPAAGRAGLDYGTPPTILPPTWRSLKNYLRGQSFRNFDHLKSGLAEFFERQPADFWERGIQALSERCRHVIDSHGEYIVE